MGPCKKNNLSLPERQILTKIVIGDDLSSKKTILLAKIAAGRPIPVEACGREATAAPPRIRGAAVPC